MIYFIRAGKKGPIRIGYTRTREDGQAAVRKMRESNHEKLIIEAIATKAGPATERELHKFFEINNIHGEWFSMSPRLKRVIDLVKAQPDVEPASLIVVASLPLGRK